MLARDSLVYVDGATVYVNLPVTGLVLSTSASMIPKRLYSMGAYILILPDKKWVNASDLTEYGSTDQVNSLAGRITYLPSRADGTDLEGTVYTQASDPGIVADGSYWIDISSSKAAVLKRYSALSKVWTVIPTEYTALKPLNRHRWRLGTASNCPGLSVETGQRSRKRTWRGSTGSTPSCSRPPITS